jgi:phosphatidylglycerol:prolipoprotein diacylglycerol transferase
MPVENIKFITDALSYTFGWFNGFIFSVFVILISLKLLKAPVLYICDLAAPSIAIGQVFGRIGCFLAGDGCYGRATDLPWGMAFPDGVVPISIPVHPTPLYEASLLLLIFIVLWRLRHHGLPEGTSIALYLVLSGTERFFVEFIRLNAKFMFNLTAPQIFSVIFICIGSRMLYLRRNALRAVLFSSSRAAQPL